MDKFEWDRRWESSVEMQEQGRVFNIKYFRKSYLKVYYCGYFLKYVYICL